MSLKPGKLDVRCENISQFCPEGAFLKYLLFYLLLSLDVGMRPSYIKVVKFRMARNSIYPKVMYD